MSALHDGDEFVDDPATQVITDLRRQRIVIVACHHEIVQFVVAGAGRVDARVP